MLAGLYVVNAPTIIDFKLLDVRFLKTGSGTDSHKMLKQSCRTYPCSFPYLLTHLDGFAKIS